MGKHKFSICGDSAFIDPLGPTGRTLEINAWSHRVSELNKGPFHPYLLTFMFIPLKGSAVSVQNQMRKSIEKWFSRVLTRINRRPHSNPDKNPTMIAFLDRPVHKKQKISLKDATINSGLHVQGIFCMPIDGRLKTGLKDHVDSRMAAYLKGTAIQRMRIDSIRHDEGYVVGYAAKSYKRGTVARDTLIVLPKSSSEF